MRLCALGWFGHRNAGDDRIAEALIHAFSPNHVTFLPFAPLPQEIVNYFDGVILTAGTWHPRNDLALSFERWSRRVHVPIVACGLGIEAIPPEARASAQALAERAAFVWLRDEESRLALAQGLPSAVADRLRVGPDVTWAYPFSPAPAHSSPRLALNLRDWHRTTWEPKKWLEAARATSLPTHAWPLAPEDSVVLRDLEPGLENSFDPRLAREASVVVGMRLHSLVFASQMGIPTVGLAYDPKVPRFLASIGRSQHVLALEEPDRLPVAVAAAIAEKDLVREELLVRRQRLCESAQALFTEATAVLEARTGLRHRLAGGALNRVGRWLLHHGHALRRPTQS